jgi:hypothetical protein
MRARARLEYETKYTADGNYAQMMNIYDLVLDLSEGKEVVVPAGAGKTI